MTRSVSGTWWLWLLLAAGPAFGLTPAQVLVVANRKSPASVELAKLYVALRGVPPENVALLDVSRGYTIDRGDYERDIRMPLARLLKERRLDEKIRCLVLLTGVPIRVTQGEAQRDKEAVYAAAAADAHKRLAMILLLSERVGRPAPAKPPEALLPPEGQFDGAPPLLPATLTAAEKLKDLLAEAIAKDQVRVRGLDDPARKQAAARQVMALTLEAYGLNGLIRYITADSPPGAPPAEGLRKQLVLLEAQIEKLRAEGRGAQALKTRLDMMRVAHGVIQVHSYAEPYATRPAARAATDPTQTPNASVDSELSLLWWGPYRVEGMLPNPLHWQSTLPAAGRPPVLMTSRLDGPSPADATRMLRDSVAVEKTGLGGRFYIDAGGPARLGGAAFQYDTRLKGLADFVERYSRLPVVMDSKPTVFPAGTCPDAALYVGWYSLQKYVPAFSWNRGSVGYHVASFEATDLRNADSPEWCPQMIRNGIAATLGPVQEPFLLAFPNPDEFFPLLLTGKFTVAEVYWRTLPVTSWQMILLADPLYNPFAARPQVPLNVLPPGLAAPAP